MLCNRVIITGATGFIGKALCKELAGNYQVVALSRNPERAKKILSGYAEVIEWDGKTIGSWVDKADGAFAIINLAGENVSSGRWNPTKKAAIIQSRINAAKAVVEAVKHAKNKPKVLIQASAIGYYGSRGDEQLDEKSESGKGFLADVCQMCEITAGNIQQADTRLVVIRTGVVLGKDGGALPRIMKPYRFFMGGYIGSGKQWFSWISLADEVAAIKFLMENQSLEGIFNLTTPQPVNMKTFCKTLGNVLRRPSWTKTPAFVARQILGQMADELFLASIRVYPKHLLEAGFEFKYNNILEVLNDILTEHK